jgi:hypothetical protein
MLCVMPKKSVQVRIPIPLASDIALIAAAMGKSVPEYVEEVLSAAAARDLPRAARLAKERADKFKPIKPDA